MESSDNKLLIPFFEGSVEAGFPSPAYDELQQSLDLHALLIKNPIATFFIRVKGNSMEGVGIHSGDLLIVDRSIGAEDGKIVVAILHGEFTIKRLKKVGEKIYLAPANSQYRPIDVTDREDFQIWGVVTYAIHRTC